MRNLVSIEEELEKLKAYLSEDDRIIALYIFGSFGTEYERESSDIDFAILYDGTISLEEELMLEVEISEIFNKHEIDLVNLNKVPLSLQHKVIYTGELLYCSNFLKLSNFKEMVFKLYGDYGITLKFFYDDYIRGMVKE
ncbi:MAG: nucleotidyltransferase domain-containing protein [Tissierellia bacterium]|nr:nucleotidyltransferase domain-containing protein [Tissierellia bacterium]